MKLSAADIYYIPNFEFQNGEHRDKYLIVLTEGKDDRLLLTLPTSIGRIPEHLEKGQQGCINCDRSQFNCYRFLKGQDVTDGESPFSFAKDTHLYGEWIADWSASSLKLDYNVEGVDYEYIGALKSELFKEILHCFIHSFKVKRKFKPRLQTLLDSMT